MFFPPFWGDFNSVYLLGVLMGAYEVWAVSNLLVFMKIQVTRDNIIPVGLSDFEFEPLCRFGIFLVYILLFSTMKPLNDAQFLSEPPLCHSY